MKRLLFCILTLVIVLGVVRHPRFYHLREALRHKAADTTVLKNSYSNLGYVLASDQWFTFPLAGKVERIKIVTNASISKESSLTKDVEYQYTLEYEIRGKGSETLHHDRFYQLSTLTHYQDLESKTTHTASLYLDPARVPVDGRVWTLNPADWSPGKQAEQIRIRLVAKDENISDVLLRIYTIEENAQPEELYNWQRLSIPWRQKQARGNVYPHDFLSDDEKINLMTRRWRPVGPLGVPGEDYHVRTLYTLKEYDDQPVLDDELPVTPSIGPQKVMTLPIAEGGLNLRFSFMPMGSSGSDEENLTLSWFGLTPAQRSRRQVSLNRAGETVVEAFFEQGLLEIRSQQPLRMQSYQQDGSEWVEWQPEPLFTRNTLCDLQSEVGFTLTNLDNRPTPLRITLRVPISEETAGEYQVEYEMLGIPAGKGILRFAVQPSLYDRLLLHGVETPVSEPVTYYWNLPLQVHGIRFNSAEPVLVAAATRPSGLSHRTRVPEDYDRTSVTDAERQPVWFPLLPDAYRELFRRQRSMLLQVQLRPPVDDPDLLAGLYRYESLRPSLQWAGRYLLLPPAQQPRLRQPDAGSMYFPLKQGAASQNFIDENSVSVIQPRLVFIKDKEETVSRLHLFLDGKPYFSTELHGSSGLLNLPAVSKGNHSLDVKISAGAELYMNHLQRDEEGYTLRFANRLTRQGLSFDYVKKTLDPERLSFTFFSPAATKRSTIRVRLSRKVPRTGSPQQDFTLLDRRFDVHPTVMGNVKVLNLNKGLVGEGKKFFFPTGRDVPPGKYSISVILEDGPEGYLVLSRITPGVYFTRRLNREQLRLEGPGAIWK